MGAHIHKTSDQQQIKDAMTNDPTISNSIRVKAPFGVSFWRLYSESFNESEDFIG